MTTTARIRLLRSNSHGLKATFARIKHHAPKIYELTKYLSRRTKDFDCEWVQGDTRHDITSNSGQTYVLRGYRSPKAGYIGIKLGLKLGHKMESEHHVLTVYFDERNGVSWSFFADLMQKVGEKKFAQMT